MSYTKKFVRKNKKVIKFVLKALISLGFLGWIIFKVDWMEVWSYIGALKPWHIGLYLLFVIAGMIISAYKWKMLSDFKKIHLPLMDFFKFYMTGTFINNFMPSFIGGDTFRAYEVGKKNDRYVEAASTVLIDRITGFVGATILVVIFSFINIKTILEDSTLVLIDLLVLLSLFFDIILAKTKKMAFWEKIYKFLPEKLSGVLRELDHYNNSSHILFKSIGWSMIFAIVGVAASNYVLFWSLGAKVGILDYLSVIFLISIVSAIPISINNIGIKEWAYVAFFGFFGVNSSIVITIAIISRFLQMILSFLALPIYLRSRQ